MKDGETAIDDGHVIENESGLRALYGEPGRLALLKELDHLDENCQRFIALSPFLCLATMGADGRVDNSPRGDAPGFVEVGDEKTLLMPDRPGNNRIDSLSNIVNQPDVGLLFFIPGFTETLRVNGRARLSIAPYLLARFAVDGRLPKLVVAITVQEAFLQCSKALIRSRLWQEDAKVDRKTLPTLGRMIADVVDARSSAETVRSYDALIERNIEEELY
ncbi:MAG: pyridoxamine 5'-phosphate oxidase family protein [Geminicoccaceae bacterium]